MATYTFTFTTTAYHDEAVQIRVDAANANRAARTPPLTALTPEQYVRGLFADMFKGWLAEDENRLVRRAQIGEALTTAEKDRIKVLLGLT